MSALTVTVSLRGSGTDEHGSGAGNRPRIGNRLRCKHRINPAQSRRMTCRVLEMSGSQRKVGMLCRLDIINDTINTDSDVMRCINVGSPP